METGAGLAFGDLLRPHRDSAGITQESLAEMSGLTPQAIGLIERGERRRPHRYTVQKLAKALALTGQDLARFESAAHGVLLDPPREALALSPRRTRPDHAPARTRARSGGRDGPPASRGCTPRDPDRPGGVGNTGLPSR